MKYGQIVWGDEEAKGRSNPYSTWSARFDGMVVDVGSGRLEPDAANLIEIENQEGPPRAFGVTLHRQTPAVSLGDPALIRARIRPAGGGAGELPILCDWDGVVIVHGSRVSVDWVALSPGPISIAVSVAIAPARPVIPPKYTETPREVPAGSYERFDVPVGARRVTLQTRRDGDVPLGQIFVSFFHQRSVTVTGWIDAASAQAALFGRGMPVPDDCGAIAIGNNSAAMLYAAPIFHLGF